MKFSFIFLLKHWRQCLAMALQALILLHLLTFRWFCHISTKLLVHFAGFYSFSVAVRFPRLPQLENHSLLLSKPKWMCCCFFLSSIAASGITTAAMFMHSLNTEQTTTNRKKKWYFKQQFAPNREWKEPNNKKCSLKMQHCALRSSHWMHVLRRDHRWAIHFALKK